MTEVLSLQDYISKYFAGSQTAFGKAFGKSSKHIWRQLNSGGFIVVNDQVCQIKYEKPGDDTL